MMEKILNKIYVKTYCPNCEKVIEDPWNCKMDSIIGIRYALLCSICQKMIGIYCPPGYKTSLKAQNILSEDILMQIKMN
ncbi:hypothetical protein ACFLSS_02105 [Bacteroidota bacterium]